MQLLDEAVREERGEKNVHKQECLVDIRIDAFIPESYISNQAQRIDVYRKIARVQTEEDSFDVIDELIDRYGEPPASVKGLVDVARLRNMAALSGLTEITQAGDVMVFYLSAFDMRRISAVTSVMGKRMRLETIGRARMSVSLEKDEKPLDVMKSVITAMSGGGVAPAGGSG